MAEADQRKFDGKTIAPRARQLVRLADDKGNLNSRAARHVDPGPVLATRSRLRTAGLDEQAAEDLVGSAGHGRALLATPGHRLPV